MNKRNENKYNSKQQNNRNNKNKNNSKNTDNKHIISDIPIKQKHRNTNTEISQKRHQPKPQVTARYGQYRIRREQKRNVDI